MSWEDIKTHLMHARRHWNTSFKTPSSVIYCSKWCLQMFKDVLNVNASCKALHLHNMRAHAVDTTSSGQTQTDLCMCTQLQPAHNDLHRSLDTWFMQEALHTAAERGTPHTGNSCTHESDQTKRCVIRPSERDRAGGATHNSHCASCAAHS